MGLFNNGRLLKEAQSELEQTRLELQNANEDLNKNKLQLEVSKNEIANILEEKENLLKRYSLIIDKENELKAIESKINDANIKLAELNEKYQTAFKIHSQLEREIELYQDNMDIRSFGLLSCPKIG